MTRYILPGLQLDSEFSFDSFRPFLATETSSLPLCTLTIRDTAYVSRQPLQPVRHGNILVADLEDGWLYLPIGPTDHSLHVSLDHRTLTAYITAFKPQPERLLALVRTALECTSIAQGVLSLHSACVELEGEAVCFTAPSGTGKSTRAMSWVSGCGARLISGDRPSVCIGSCGISVSGAPWDGKEQLFINRSVPLRAICSIRRGDNTYVRALSPSQARRVLYQQCFLPLWDTEMAVTAMMQISRICDCVPVYRVTCGPDEAAANEVRDIIMYHPEAIRKAEPNMKIKHGFVLRKISGEHIVMPTGQNIRAFDGAIVLNDTAAFVWEKLCEGCSWEELLQVVLSEFEVDRPQAEADLDVLLHKLHGYQVIDDEAV